jgi:hypothetical protein
MAPGLNSTVFLLHQAGPGFAPTQTGPFPAGVPGTGVYLWSLSPNANAQTFPLACLGNAATYQTGPIAPGGFVTLFGSGLGPQQGVQPQATLQSPFPTQAASVEVTFDGTPAALLWVQDAQMESSLKFINGDTSTSVDFINETAGPVLVYWLNYSGARVYYNTIPSGYHYVQQTYITHPWVVTNNAGTCQAIFHRPRTELALRTALRFGEMLAAKWAGLVVALPLQECKEDPWRSVPTICGFQARLPNTVSLETNYSRLSAT